MTRQDAFRDGVYFGVLKGHAIAGPPAALVLAVFKPEMWPLTMIMAAGSILGIVGYLQATRPASPPNHTQ